MKILLPIESAPDAKLTIDFVANYRWLRGTEFKILHVLGSSNDDEVAIEAKHCAENLVDSVAGRIRSSIPDCKVTVEVLAGQPIYEILQMATNWKATMIVMGFKARSSAHRFLAGSVSRGVALQAPCSVSIIRPPEEYRVESAEQSIFRYSA